MKKESWYKKVLEELGNYGTMGTLEIYWRKQKMHLAFGTFLSRRRELIGGVFGEKPQIFIMKLVMRSAA